MRYDDELPLIAAAEALEKTAHLAAAKRKFHEAACMRSEYLAWYLDCWDKSDAPVSRADYGLKTIELYIRSGNLRDTEECAITLECEYLEKDMEDKIESLMRPFREANL